MVRSHVLLSSPEQHTGRPQPPSVLICCDCCSLIIENNKVKSFLSCLVCCLSLWPLLSDAAACLDPLDPNGSSVISGTGTAGGASVYLLQRVRSSVSCNRNDISELIVTSHHKSTFLWTQSISNTDVCLWADGICVTFTMKCPLLME